MLRHQLGEEDFWQGVADYIDRHKYTTVTTEEFRFALEDASGRDLELFFRQWCYTPGTPTLNAGFRYSPASKIATVTIQQTQRISDMSPAFQGPLEIYFRTEQGDEVIKTVELSNRHDVFEIALPGKPAVFAPNYRAGFLCRIELSAPLEIVAETAINGPTTFSRLWAIRSLREAGGIATVEPLATIAGDDSAFFGERELATDALGKLDEKAAGLALVEIAEAMLAASPDASDWRVRDDVASALRNFDEDLVIELLLRLAEDPSDYVAREAVTGLGLMLDERVEPALVAAAERRGDHDRILSSAVGAIARRGDIDSIDAVLRATEPDVQERLRGRMIGALASLLEDEDIEDGNPYAERLMEYLGDTQDRARRAAFGALGRIQYEPALPRLEQIKARSSDDWSRHASDAITAINGDDPTYSKFLELQKDFAKLEMEFEKMKAEAEEKSQAATRAQRGASAEAEPKKKRKKFLGIF